MQEVARASDLRLGLPVGAHGLAGTRWRHRGRHDSTVSATPQLRQGVVFSGGPISTMDASTPGPEVVVVQGETIVAVGARALLERYPDTPTVDLAGRTLLPGFIDAHNHLSIAALHPRFGEATAVADRDALVAAVRAQAAAEPEADWVRLWGWGQNGPGYAPLRADLDAAEIDRPIVLAHSSLHQCVVSSAALDRLGIGRSTPDPQGGEIAHDPDGTPNGLLVERAWSDAHAQSMAAYADPDRWADHVATRARLLLRDGVVAVHDAACSPQAEAVYHRLARTGDLPVSVLVMPHSARLLTNDLGGRLDGATTGDGDHRVRVGPVKLFADGGIAIALDVHVGGRRMRYGSVMDDLGGAALRAARAGFRIAVHAMGNLGVDHATTAFTRVRQALGDGDHRFRLEHAGVTTPASWRALADLDAVAVVQPGFVEHVGIQSGGVVFDDAHWLAFSGLADAGVVIAGSSDDPCAPYPPLWCARLGESRATSSGISFEPDQRVDLDDWLRAYTLGAAFAGGQEHERGRLAPGLRADFVVLDRGGPEPRVAQTWIAGQLVHDAP